VEPDSWLHSDQRRLPKLLRGAAFRAWFAGAELTDYRKTFRRDDAIRPALEGAEELRVREFPDSAA
jgi:hypothetical protein